MFKEILKSKINITDTLYLRFDINAFIKAEIEGINIFDMAEVVLNPQKVIKLLKIGLSDCLENDNVLISEAANKTIKMLGADITSVYLQTAILEALPEPVIGGNGNNAKGGDISKVYGLFVDVMGRTEEEFLKLTLREVMKRWDNYAVFNGYKKPGIEIKAFDDD